MIVMTSQALIEGNSAFHPKWIQLVCSAVVDYVFRLRR